MLDGLMEWGRNIVYFSVFSVLIKNLLPGEKYVPYVRLYMGFMMLLVFFTPILKFLDADKTLYYLTDILGGVLEIKEDAFLASLDENSNYERQKEEYSDRLEVSVVDYLTEALSGQAEWQDYYVERAEVRWEEAEELANFGAITGITMYLKKDGKTEVRQNEKTIVIEPILVEVFSESNQTAEGEEEEIWRQLKEETAEFYHIGEENIVVRTIE